MINRSHNSRSVRKRQRLFWLLLTGSVLALALTFVPPLWCNDNSIQIRSSQQGYSLPDGFFVWQRLHEQGIQIKSITPHQNTLIVRFDSAEQSAAAELVLRQLLPCGVDIARITPSSSRNSWIPRIVLRS